MKICFLDLETTGFSAEKDSIIEISFLIREEISGTKNISVKFDEVVIPAKSELTPFISHLTGISSKEIINSSKQLVDMKKDINQLIGDSVICGHNIDFDINFLIANGIDVSKNQRIDTHELARILLPEEQSYALEILAEKYGFIHTDAHRAMSDVEASMQLFDFLIQKIDELPSGFLREIKPILANEKFNWFAKDFFLQATGNSDFIYNSPNEKNDNTENCIKIPNLDLTQNKNFFIRSENSVDTAGLQKAFVQATDDKFLIISPKLDFFKSVKKVPTPEVLFDRNKLEVFEKKRSTMNEVETTFWIKCKFRDYLGLRGLHFFDLFSNNEKDLWAEVCCDDNSPIFLDSLQKRINEKILAVSTKAFFRLINSEILQNRILIIDETEIFANDLLFSPQKEYSLQSFLENPDENISIITQFFVTRFCKEVVEKKLNHAISPFPQKLLFGETEFYPELAEEIKKIQPDNQNLINMAKILAPANKNDKTVRWLRYFPDNGNLIFQDG